ncbi:NAD(+) kinase [Nevskia soli]|uniref:NAD(+) kinase n=1 Tax=Nevskia soli TaxID=418856 RepID=UPI0004A6E39A|nr:NAD(+) kinase [Nevskia soli]
MSQAKAAKARYSTIAIIGKRDDARAAETLRSVATALLARRQAGQIAAVLAPDANRPEMPGLDVEFLPMGALASRSDLAIVVGGDGTLLGAGRALAPHGVPILGVNQGRLGFMVDVLPEDLNETLDAVLGGDLPVEERLLLEATLRRADTSNLPLLHAVNDVVVRNQASIRMLEFETWLDGEFISQHRADGIVVATPTGSTAYALSGGGPVLHPSLHAVALVPICPHTLSDRPIVVPAGGTIRIVLRGEVSGVSVTCDGQVSVTLDAGDSVEVTSSPHRLRLIHPRNYSFFELLRNKLHWGRGPGGAERL